MEKFVYNIKLILENTKEKEDFIMVAKEIGEIKITVYKSEDGYSFFYLRPNTEKLLPIVDILEDTLKLY